MSLCSHPVRARAPPEAAGLADRRLGGPENRCLPSIEVAAQPLGVIAALLVAFVMCWERPAGAAVLWERDHGSWRVSMESDRLGARGPRTCRLQTSCAAKGAAPSTVAFSLGGGTAVLVLSWLNPMVPPDWRPQPWTLLFFAGRSDITPGALVGDGAARRLVAAAADERDDIGVFLRALSRTDSLHVPHTRTAGHPGRGGGCQSCGARLLRLLAAAAPCPRPGAPGTRIAQGAPIEGTVSVVR